MKSHSIAVGERKVLGVRIDDIPKEEVLEKISEAEEGFLIFTPGPEFLVTASKDKEFKEILNSSDLNVPDGVGLRLAGIKNRVPGVDLMVDVCRVASANEWSVGLLGGVGEVSLKASEKLKEKFPKLKIKFAISDDEADKIIRSLNIPYDRVDVFLVGLGHPKQEKFLLNIVKLKKIKFKIGMGVGGSFDLIAGVKPRAPRFMQEIGLEWLWRGLQNPGHFTRVWRATGEYIWLLISSKTRGLTYS